MSFFEPSDSFEQAGQESRSSPLRAEPATNHCTSEADISRGTERALPLDDDSAARRIIELPKEVGAMLVSVGVLGFVMPGMMGTPAIIAGGLVLWPQTFGKVENWFQRRYPALHKQGMRQVGRYLEDLERRYSDPNKSHA